MTDLESVPIRFTRLQYAKIMYQNFHIPKKFHTASVCVGNAENRELSKSFELGCRLSCGLESAYQRNKSEIGSNLQRYQSTAKLEKEQAMKRNTKAQIYYGSCHKEDLAVSTLIDSLLEGKNGKHRDHKAIDKSCQEATYAKNLLKDYNMKKNILQEDSDSWMYLSPDELDKEMESRVKKFKENNSALNSQLVNKSVAAEGKSSSPTVKDDKTNINKKKDSDVRQNEDAEQLQKMIEGMNLFLGSKSDISGVTTDIKRHDQKHIKMEKEKTEKKLADEVENCEKEIEIVKNNDSTKLASNSINDVHIFSSDWRSNLPSGIKNVDNMHQFDSNNDDDDDDDDEEEDQVREDIVIDFDKVLDILKNFNLTERKEEISKEDSSKPKEVPLQDYFYENDLTELSSNSGSDNDSDSGSDSDDEVENDATQKSANNRENFSADSSSKVDMSSLTLNEEVEKFSEWGSGGKGVNHNIRTATVGVREIRFDNAIIKKKVSRMGKHDMGKSTDGSSNDNTASIENKVTNKQCGDDDDAVRYDMSGISKVQDPKGSLLESSGGGSGSIQAIQRQIGSVQISNSEEVNQGIINRDSDDSGDDDSFYDDSESETDSDDEVDFTAATQKGNSEKKKKSSSEYVRTGVQQDDSGSDGEDMERKNCYAEYEVREDHT